MQAEGVQCKGILPKYKEEVEGRIMEERTQRI